MKALRYYRLTILWALFVLVMCSISFGPVGTSPLFFPGFDKLAHCGFLFVLVVFCCNDIIRQQNTGYISYKSAIRVTALAILYGGIIEVLQLTVFTWRSGDWADLFADSLGACMGIFSVVITDRAINNEN
jgi:VanZ family protein